MIYLDNAATTRVNDDTVDIIRRYLTEDFYNPSALYKPAVDVSTAIRKSREGIARLINANSDDIYFLASGTEADNIALFYSRKREGSRIIISSAEHSAIYNSSNELSLRGYDVVLAPVDRYGKVISQEFIKLLNENTSLVSIMHVNNETGAINDIEHLAKITKEYNKKILFHSDGVQAFTKVNIYLNNSDIDLYSISGHKINAPKGIAGIYIKKGVSIKPILYGGGQEKNIRSSTENTSGIIALNYAANCSTLKYAEYYNNMKQLLQFTVNMITQGIENTIINTNLEQSSCNILSIALKNVRGEVMMHSLEKYGIIIGIGSACTSKKGVKRIPTALNLPKEYHDGMIRISINPDTTEEELRFTSEMIIKEYKELLRYTRE